MFSGTELKHWDRWRFIRTRVSIPVAPNGRMGSKTIAYTTNEK